ncbi:GntR family transcriptional regulator [Bacillus sp. APMAM]|uniref:GntR family transcriptional regulator n=1 Tax=Margalitia sp. FSL K6-0131 TaxID=2954604 RepID=UPI000F85BDE7|nr:GntR family transcriptional regulator [Bacillus sp. APMAM]RTZ55326.1 GntR family transcriptional regulator [Bacillus sp. SAJ1]
MKIIIKNVSDQPLYLQIKEQIKASILQGELKEGEQLPSIRALASDLNVSVLTTKRVYEELEKEGFIVTKAGKGSYVAPENLEMMLETKRKIVEKQLLEAWKTAKLVGITKEEFLLMIDLLMEEDD